MRVLTVKAPWGHLIASGQKTIEVRSWSTDYRGPVAFIQGLGVNRHAMQAHGLGLDRMCRGSAVAVRNLVDVRPICQLDSSAACFSVEPNSEDFAWLLEGGAAIDPFHWPGSLGLIKAKPDFMRRLRERQAA